MSEARPYPKMSNQEFYRYFSMARDPEAGPFLPLVMLCTFLETKDRRAEHEPNMLREEGSREPTLPLTRTVFQTIFNGATL